MGTHTRALKKKRATTSTQLWFYFRYKQTVIVILWLFIRIFGDRIQSLQQRQLCRIKKHIERERDWIVWMCCWCNRVLFILNHFGRWLCVGVNIEHVRFGSISASLFPFICLFCQQMLVNWRHNISHEQIGLIAPAPPAALYYR